MTGRRPRIRVRPGRRRVEVLPGETILDALHRRGIPLGASCGGAAACAGCAVTVLAGRLPRRGPAEVRLAAREGFARDERAACQVRPREDCTLTTPYW